MRDGGGTLLDQEPMRDGRTRCRVTFDSFEEAYLDLVRLGAEVEVLEPDGSPGAARRHRRRRARAYTT